DRGLGEGSQGSFAHEIEEALVALSEARHPRPRDPYVHQAYISNLRTPGVNVLVAAETAGTCRFRADARVSTPPGCGSRTLASAGEGTCAGVPEPALPAC